MLIRRAIWVRSQLRFLHCSNLILACTCPTHLGPALSSEFHQPPRTELLPPPVLEHREQVMENSTANDRPELYEIEALASLSAVKARTMFQMVVEMQLPEIQSSYKVLFLTNEQSAILAEPAVDEKTRVPKMMRLFDAFELPQPSLVIFLLHSQGTPHVCNMRGAEVGSKAESLTMVIFAIRKFQELHSQMPAMPNAQRCG